MPFFSGHDEENDDMLNGPAAPTPGQQAPRTERYGYNENPINRNWTGQLGDPRRYRGKGYYQENGQYVPGTSGAEQEVARYQGMGMATQAPVGIDRTRTGESRGLMMGSLGHLQNVADGRESEALRLGQDQARQAALGQTSMAASVRGGAMARAAASSAANRGIARSNAQIANYARAGQAAEMQQARQQLMQGSTGLRTQDLGLAGSQADLAARQRALDEHRQQTYEGMASDVTDAELFARLEAQKQDEQQAAAQRRQRAAEKQADTDKAFDIFNVATGGVGGFLGDLSDERAKTNIVPVGSLARFMR